MHDLDKRAMGRRIRQIRLAAGLRQWELAKLLGTTQSAVHKYEHGVVPEPRRLVELARVGGTTIEWVLTGQHWEGGSEARERLPREVLELARRLHELGGAERAAVEEALRIVREALAALERPPAEEVEARTSAAALRAHGPATLRLLEAAWRIQRSVLGYLAEDAGRRLEPGPADGGDGRPARG